MNYLTNKELLYALDYVFEHYLDSDLDDEQREVVETAYEQLKELIK